MGQLPYNAFMFPSQLMAEATARVLGCESVAWLDRMGDEFLESSFDGTLRQFTLWVNSSCLAIAQTPPEASARIHDYIESVAEFLQANLPPSIRVVRLSSPTDCMKETCRDRTVDAANSLYTCCNVDGFRDCKKNCIDSRLFNQVVSDYCSSTLPANITLDVSCWNWTFFCSPAFVQLEGNTAKRNCSVGFNQGYAYHAHLDLIQLGRTVVMPVFQDDRRFEQQNVDFFESSGFRVGA